MSAAKMQQTSRKKPRAPRSPGGPTIPHWERFCGHCARTGPVVTDGRMLRCWHCGH